MSKSKFDLDKAEAELAAAPPGLAHALNLLLLAIGRGQSGAGALLDEFTAMHADYLAQLQARARECDERIADLEPFSQAARMIYRRLSELDAKQAASARRELAAHLVSSLRLH